MKVITNYNKKKFGLKKMVWNLNVQLEVVIATRCSTNLSKVANASVAKNQRTMRKKRK